MIPIERGMRVAQRSLPVRVSTYLDSVFSDDNLSVDCRLSEATHFFFFFLSKYSSISYQTEVAVIFRDPLLSVPEKGLVRP